MSLEYYLKRNHITSDEDDYMAISINPESYSIEDVYDYMTREGSTVTRAEALAGFEEVTRAILNLVQQGHSVVTPLVNIRPGISGVFDSEDDRFDTDRHEVRINVSPGLRLRETADEIPTQKVEPRERIPTITHYSDNSSGSRDAEITPGGGARIVGQLLKFDEEDPDQGIFFVNTSNGTETRVESTLLRNKPSELIFINPELDPGTYRLEVRAILQDTTNLRTGLMTDQLTVEDAS
ncbi:DNA-binding domain-containing protein [Halalkalibaculum sp. DA384]|uniref:DNA-binding domain-containing protein n=1 Tax=Halalkalibaculum sp. DA384 TaxID=3373606 RepID=UPI00375472B8